MCAGGCIKPIYRGPVKSKKQNRLGLALLQLQITDDSIVLVKCILTVRESVHPPVRERCLPPASP